MDICVDFDGTCVTHEYPRIGKDVGALPVLKRLLENGHRLILFTMRSDSEDGNYLTDAVEWLGSNGVPLYGINTNPTQREWTNSPKAYGQLYIDDAGAGCPLILDSNISTRPFVDWILMEELLEKRGLI